MPDAVRAASRKVELNMEAEFTRVAIVGTGLIGGSVGLALRAAGFAGTICGCDRPEVLRTAMARGAIDQAVPDLERAVRPADMVILATPVGATLTLLPQVAKAARPDALVTDTGSTKASICRTAAGVFGGASSGRFVGGHPIAGSEHSGVEHADAGLFRGCIWVLTPEGEGQEGSANKLGAFLGQLGTQVVRLSPHDHDLTLAFTSHLPQVVSWALAEAAQEGLSPAEASDLVTGPGWRDMTRLSRSPRALWQDVFRTNAENVTRALELMEQALRRAREQVVRAAGDDPAGGTR